MHEAKTHRFNVWVTLTYEDKYLPSKYNTGLIHPVTNKTVYSGSLRKEHMQKFYRRTRKQLNKTTEGQILHSGTPAVDYLPPNGHIIHKQRLEIIPIHKQLRYYYAGEYGEKYRRPHYHACLFGIDFRDKKQVTTTDAGFKLYESATMAKLWPWGRHTLSELTWETAAYTARYIMKKITGKQQKHKYDTIDIDTGEIITLEPEFNDMSRKPGIANAWFQKYKEDVYHEKDSYVIQRGHKKQPPRYYDKLHKRLDVEHHEIIKAERAIRNLLNWENNRPQRLQAEEIITTRKIQSLKQKL